MLNIILIALIAFGSALILITSGFGFGSLFMAIIPLLIPYQDAAFISVLTTMFLQIVVIAKYFNKINWRLIIIPTVISFITGSIGVHLMVKMTASTMALILGIFLWILAFYMIWIAPKIHLKKVHLLKLQSVHLVDSWVGCLLSADHQWLLIMIRSLMIQLNTKLLFKHFSLLPRSTY